MRELIQAEDLAWRVQSFRRTGSHYFETTTAVVDPWALLASRMLALRLSSENWLPVTAGDVDATGAGEGWARLTRIVSQTGDEHSEHYTLAGSIVFLNAERNVALYVELIAGKVEQRTTAQAALDHVAALPVGLRWLGSIVPSGSGLKGRIANIEREIASRYRRLVGDGGWVQVPFCVRSGVLRMSETKVKAALLEEPRRLSPRAGKVKLQIMARTGQWRSIQSRPVEVGPAGLLVGPHSFTTAEKDGYIYLTATGAIEPTYRLPLAEYNKLKETNHVEKTVR